MNHPIVVAALAVGLFGCLFILIGMATASWLVSTESNVNVGLFTLCDSTGCASLLAEGSMIAVRAIIVISFLCSAAGCIDNIIYYVKYLNQNTTHVMLALITAVLYVISAVAVILGVIIFGAKTKAESDELAKENVPNGFTIGFSFGLTLVGGLFSAAAGALSLVHRRGLQS